MTQTESVLKYMEQYGSITSLEAFRNLGVTRLSSCIFILRKKGYPITSETEVIKNRYGNNSRYSRYKIVGEIR